MAGILKRGLSFFLSAVLFFVIATLTALPVFADPPAGFVKTQVATGFNLPTDFAFLPNGTIFVTEQSGGLHVVHANGSVTTAATIPVDSQGEHGLLGIAIDPDFPSNHFVYLDYVNANPLQIRVSRFIYNPTTEQLDLTSEKILLHSTQTLGLVHMAGTLRFGPDGKLWISVGNNNGSGITGNSQDISVGNIHGKILRINPDGTIPSNNPFAGQTDREQSIWAYGFRNPFRFSFSGDVPIVGDVGDSSWEEIDNAVFMGNYGYPLCEGFCQNGEPYINPLYAYPHPTSGNTSASVTGGFIYTGSQFPTAYKGNYFFGDYAQRFIKRMTFDANGNVANVTSFDDTAGSAVELEQGPDGSLYYIQIYGSGFGTPGILWKYSYNPQNVPPSVTASANAQQSDTVPFTVTFSSQGTTDPLGKPLTYSWNFGDGTTSTQANPTHTYTTQGVYYTTLTASNGTQSATSDKIQIAAGDKYPDAQITTPLDQSTYNAGQTVSYSGSATDAKDGTLPASAYSWYIIFHHSSHVHPFITDHTGVKTDSFVIPDTGEPSADTWYEIRLTVTDSLGLQKTVSENILPNKVMLTLDANPQTATITLDGVPVQAPYSVASVVGFKHTIGTTSPQIVNNNTYGFASWSDNGAQAHQIATPNMNTTYTATFTSLGNEKSNLRFRITEFDGNNSWTGHFLNGITVKLTDTQGNTVYSTQTSSNQNGEDGWVFFDNITPGTYGILAYKQGFQGVWKEGGCDSQGTFDNTTVTNLTTDNNIAAFDNNVQILGGQTITCRDLGLKNNPFGSLYFRVMNIDTSHPSAKLPYSINGYLNDVTVKLTDTSGNTVIKTTSSVKAPNGEDGWVFIDGILGGQTYGLMAYKDGYDGYLKQVDCNGQQIINSTITNNNTNGDTAAWNASVPITAGTITSCYDMGLLPKPGSIAVRMQEWDQNGWTGRFLNDVTVKLTDQTGSTLINTATSSASVVNGQDGWVKFDNLGSGTYGMLAYKSGFSGVWKEVNCSTPGGSFDNATIQNTLTDGQAAAWDTSVTVTGGNTTNCHDLGLQAGTVSPTGNLHFRIVQFDQNNNWTGTFLNGVTVKLTDTSGNTVLKTTTSSSSLVQGQDGWVFFDQIPSGTYGILAYKQGMQGLWKEVGCSTVGGSFADATMQNANTEGTTAAFDGSVVINANKTTTCHDLGLRTGTQTPTGSLRFRIMQFASNNNATGTFMNDVTVKLTDTSGNTMIKTATSSASFNQGQDGWVFFDNIPATTYGIMAYKSGQQGIWKQVGCSLQGGSYTDATIQNTNSDSLTAAWDNNVIVNSGQVTTCHDLGLKPVQAVTPIPLPSPRPTDPAASTSATPSPLPAGR